MPPGNRCTSHQQDNSAMTGAEVPDFLGQRVYQPSYPMTVPDPKPTSLWVKRGE